MKISREAWDLKEECFGPLLPYVKDQQVTDINYNGTDVWIELLKYGIRKAPVNQIGRASCRERVSSPV